MIVWCIQDLEGASRPKESPRGSRKRRKSDEWVKTKKKKARNSIEAAGTPRIACKHNTSFCNAVLLSQADVDAFAHLLYSHSSSADQNAYLMNYVIPYEPMRKRSQKDNPRKRTSYQYSVRALNGNLVLTCAKTFASIVMFGKYQSLCLCIKP